MKISEHANYLLNEYGRLQFDYAAYCKPDGESLRNEARNNLEEYIAELEAAQRWHVVKECNDVATPIDVALRKRIAELEGKIDQLTAHDATERQDDKWIPVSERLPEDRVTILAAFNNREILTAKYYKYYEGFGSVENYWRIEGWHSGNVTHWMPLPTPPEADYGIR